MAADGASSSAPQQKRKQVVISVSSSDYEEDEDEDDDDGAESDGEYEDEDDDDDGAESDGQYEDEEEEGSDEEDESSSEDGSGSEADYEGEEEEEDDGEEEEEKEAEEDSGSPEGRHSEEELYKKVVDYLDRKRNLDALKLEECKAYLRKHKLRLSGTKATCIERILEHSRIKGGSAEKVYPRSSFVINCTGDVCKGDVILFKQRVYEKFDIVTRGGNIIGKRVVAGRVVKESYGAAKQQHTFTVEVLWSKGVKPLRPLSPLLVKGRNLYKMKTFRQSWSNEAERSKVLAEKHRRGAAARHVRAVAKARSANKGYKRPRNSSTSKPPPNKRRKKEPRLASKKKKQNIPHTQTPSNGHARMKQVVKARHKKSSATQQKNTSYHGNAMHAQPSFPQAIPHNHCYTQMELHQRNELAASQANRGMYHLPSHGAGYPAAIADGTLHHHVLNRGINIRHPYAIYSPQFGTRSSSHTSTQVFHDPGPRAPSGEQFHRWRPR